MRSSKLIVVVLPWLLLAANVALAGTTWNTTNAGANVNFNNGNLTATFTGTSYQSAISTTSKSNGKWHFEFTANTSTNDSMLVGISDTSIPTNYCGSATHNIGGDMEPTNTNGLEVFQNGARVNFYTIAVANSDVIAVEVDVGGALIWWQDVTLATGWTNSNNTMTGNPGAGTGGISFTASTPVFICAAGATAGGVTPNIVMNPGPSFAGTVSSGFSAWDAPSGSSPTRTLLGVGR